MDQYYWSGNEGKYLERVERVERVERMERVFNDINFFLSHVIVKLLSCT